MISDRKGSVNSDVFTKSMADILQELTAEDPVKRVVEDFSVLTEFLSQTKGEDVSRIEGSLLQEFLADRNLWGFRRALDVEMKLGKVDFEVGELEMTIRRYQELKDEFGTSPEEGSKEKTDVEIKEETPLNESTEEEGVETKNEGDWILDDLLTGELTKQRGSTEGEEEKEESEEREKEKGTGKAEDQPKTKKMRIIRRDRREEEGDEDILFEEDPLSGERPENGEIGVLGSSIDEKSRKSFVKKLFGGDTTGYRKLIEKLNEADSWRVAKILIDNELFKRDVDPFSREAIKLVDLVYGRYYPEEGVGGGK
jgi:hypothetical protein